MIDEPLRSQRILRKHLHDARNSINCLNLETEWLKHLAIEAEVAATVERMRAELRELEATMQTLQAKIFPPRPSTLPADELFQLWQDQIEPLENATHRISWKSVAAAGDIEIDVDAILSVLREWVTTAWHHNEDAILHAAIGTTASHVVFSLREHHQTATPAEEEFEEIKRIADANGGKLTLAEDTSTRDKILTLEFPFKN